MRNRKFVTGAVAAVAMLAIILDTKTAVLGAREGIELCLQVIIPSLFPFLVLGGIVNFWLMGTSWGIVKPLGKLCGMPGGSESLLLLGFVAGYPVGAQLVAETYRSGNISRSAAKRMLGFCNNAGPSFIFGMIAPLFRDPFMAWLLWILQILGAITVACILTKQSTESCVITKQKSLSLPQALHNGIRSLAAICGWVISFRIVLSFCNQWFLRAFSPVVQVVFSGFLELSNGCIMLKSIPSEGLRFILASAMLSFGGLCVGMQTSSVTADLCTGWYFPGKVLQSMITLSVSCFIQPFVFAEADAYFIPASMFYILILATVLYCCVLRKNSWHLRKKCDIIQIASQ